MKKNLFIILIIISVFLSSCTSASLDATGKILPPKNMTTPLSGKWTIEKAFDKKFNDITDKKSAPLIGETAEFSSDAVMVGKYFWTDPEYKLKNIISDEYFVLKYQKSPEKLGIQNKEIIVVTVTSSDRFIYEFVKINDNECLAEIDNCLYYIRKVSEQVDSDFTKKISRENIPDDNTDAQKDNKAPVSGVFIGLKSVENTRDTNNKPYFSYRTLFIESVNKSISPVMEANDIFFPRRTGFWKLESRRITEGTRTEDIITAYDTSGDISNGFTMQSEDSSIWENKIGIISRSILSVCNDYISIESSGSGKFENGPGNWSNSWLQLQPVDSINKLKGISIEDAAGFSGLTALNDARLNFIKTLGNAEINDSDENSLNKNFALTRKTGHWFFKGRINYSKNNTTFAGDFNINLMPSSKIIVYDTLYIPWTTVKDKVPEATDVYTSPSKDIAVIVTPKNLLVYGIEGGTLSNSPLKKIKLKENETVIMSEWTTRDYVYSWEKSFLKNPVKLAE